MRIAFLATHFTDYSLEAAMALSPLADVLLLADRAQLDCDSSAEKRAALAGTGRLAQFRQKRFSRIVAVAVAVLRIALFRPDIVIAHLDARLHVTLIYALVARLARLVLIVHDPVAHRGRDRQVAEKRTWQVKRQVASASLFLAHGPYCTKTWSRADNRYGPIKGRPVVAVPHGPVLRPDTMSPLPAQCRVLMFGRMEAYKGLDVLLAALRLLVARNVDIELRLAGDGPELQRLAPAFAALAQCSIRRGFVPRGDAMSEFRDAAVVVVPYTEATQSGVVAAAFAHGRPVIASRVGGLPDFVRHGENGLLVPPGDPTALADAIEVVARDRTLLQRLARGARDSSANEMSWEIFAARSLGEIRHMLTAKSPAETARLGI